MNDSNEAIEDLYADYLNLVDDISDHALSLDAFKIQYGRGATLDTIVELTEWSAEQDKPF